MIKDKLIGINMGVSEDLGKTVGGLWQEKIQVFLLAKDAQFQGSVAIDRDKNLRSDWHNASTVPEFESKYFPYVSDMLSKKTVAHDRIFVHQMVLTPGADEIVEGLKPTADISNLKELTASFSRSLSKYLGFFSKLSIPGGVFMVDFVDEKRAREVVRLNLR